MLADACEARVRAERPAEADALRSLIKNIISSRVSSGQLDDTRLTLRDLDDIVDSFTATLRGIYHPRIHYPNQEMPPVPDATQQAITIPIPKKPEKSMDISVR